MRIVVTGATGFVGAAVRKALVAAGHDVVALVRAPGAATAPEAVERPFDLADVVGMAELFRGADAVVHAAGTSSLGADEQVLGWLEVAATENVVRAARHAGVRRLVTFSTTDVSLGTTTRKDWNEVRSVASPVSLFGRIARAKEESTIGAGTARFEPVVLRAGWLYGPGDRTRAPGLVAEAETHGALRVVGRGLAFLPATYVGNLAHAAVLATEAAGAAHGIYHVLDRELTGQHPFLARLSIALGLELPRVGGPLVLERALARIRGAAHPLDEAEVLRRGVGSLLDVKRARVELGFEPPFSQEEGMVALGRWVEELGGPARLRGVARPTPGVSEIEALRVAAG